MKFVTAKIACFELGITKVTLEYWEQQGMIKTICDRNNVKRYDLDSLASEHNNKRLAQIPAVLDLYRPNWVTPKEARERLGVSKNTLLNWEAAGKITTMRDASNHRLYDLNSVYLD
ncbi:MAG: MerR family DNA-binding transcriptional regulator [Moorea sp. SIO4A3]|nr:MerR family DNA-binding transcriptional regulator [Moorena sp. SIO4A3]NEQ79330.1 MerR family DNA-binding transcriptional regulator [Moorena sp. SIO2I5]